MKVRFICPWVIRVDFVILGAVIYAILGVTGYWPIQSFRYKELLELPDCGQVEKMHILLLETYCLLTLRIYILTLSVATHYSGAPLSARSIYHPQLERVALCP